MRQGSGRGQRRVHHGLDPRWQHGIHAIGNRSRFPDRKHRLVCLERTVTDQQAKQITLLASVAALPVRLVTMIVQ